MKASFSISIKSILVLENGIKRKKKGENALSFMLINPGIGTDSKTTIKTVKLEKGKKKSFKQKSWGDKNLFKEEIVGQSSIKINLTAIYKPSKFVNIINKAIDGGLLIAPILFPPVKGIAMVSGIIKSTAKSIFEISRDGNNKKVTIIGEAEVPLNANQKDGELVMHLTTPEKMVFRESIKKGDDIVLVKKIIPKGFAIATVILDVTRLDISGHNEHIKA